MGVSSFDVNDDKLVDYMPRIVVTGERQRQLLVHNPMWLYGPEKSNHGA